MDVALSIAWYRPNQWALLKSVAADPEIIEDTYLEWEAVAERTLADLRAMGLSPMKVDVDVEKLVQWCEKKRRPVDAEARADYANVLRRQMDEERG